MGHVYQITVYKQLPCMKYSSFITRISAAFVMWFDFVYQISADNYLFQCKQTPTISVLALMLQLQKFTILITVSAR